MDKQQNLVCALCFKDPPGIFENALEKNRVKSNVRAFCHQEFTVWRCPYCRSLTTLEKFDFAKYYANYPIQAQQLDFPTRLFFSQRLKLLRKSGLKKNHRILDYGCGNGNFVRYLKTKGYVNSVGYDPYSNEYCDPRLIEDKFDFVTSQDVIEHTEDPKDYFRSLASLVSKGGMLVIGTPNASLVDIFSQLDRVGRLHQPYHCHILTEEILVSLFEKSGFLVTNRFHRFYVDTFFPFLNSGFLFRYMQAVDGCVESGFEPIRLGLILRQPKLLLYGFLGRWLSPEQDITIAGILK